jgi:hypothetical protein
VSTEREWSSIPPGCSNALDDDDDDNDDGADQYVLDKFDITTATHSSPISTVRTPPDFPSTTAVHAQHQHHRFAKQLDTSSSATACFDLDSALDAASVELGAAGSEMVCDPFGLDASLFSI